MILIWSIGNFKHQLNSKLIFVGLLLFICMDNSNSVTFEQEVTLSESQLMALQEFKQRVIPKLKVDYMKEDIYLVKWLRARKFDVEKAVDFLNRHLSWRDNTNFDKLDDSYFQEFINEYPYEIVGQDKEGKPSIEG